MTIWTKAFWRAAAERAIGTFAQTLGGLLAADEGGELVNLDLIHADWRGYLMAAGVAALLSVLKSVAANTRGNPGPSATGAEKLK